MERQKSIVTSGINFLNASHTEIYPNYGYRTLFFKDYTFKNVDENNGFYQFGVFSGISMMELLRIFKFLRLPIKSVYGFDSFEGIPACEVEPLWHSCWGKGEFNSCDYLGVDSPAIACDLISKEVSKFLYDKNQKLHMIPGFFSDTLNLVSPDILRPAMLIDIDTDIYSSAKDALSFMAKNKLIRVGTVISYDDWDSSPGYQEFKTGESRAHKEICDEFGIVCVPIKSTGGQIAFEVIKIN